MATRIDLIEPWPETKAVMEIIQRDILDPDYEQAGVTRLDRYDQLLVLQDYINAHVAIWSEWSSRRTKVLGITVERKNDDG